MMKNKAELAEQIEMFRQMAQFTEDPRILRILMDLIEDCELAIAEQGEADPRLIN